MHGGLGSLTSAQPFAEKKQFRGGKRSVGRMAAYGVDHVVSGLFLPFGVHACDAGALGHAAALHGHVLAAAAIPGLSKGGIGAREVVVGRGLMGGLPVDGRGKGKQISGGGGIKGSAETMEAVGIDAEHVRHVRVVQGMAPSLVAGGALHLLDKRGRVHVVERLHHAGGEHIVQDDGPALQRIALHAAQRAGVAVAEIHVHERQRGMPAFSIPAGRHIAGRHPGPHVARKVRGDHGILPSVVRQGRTILHGSGYAVAAGHGRAGLLHGLFHARQQLLLRIRDRLCGTGAERGRDLMRPLGRRNPARSLSGALRVGAAFPAGRDALRRSLRLSALPGRGSVLRRRLRQRRAGRCGSVRRLRRASSRRCGSSRRRGIIGRRRGSVR